ncbi:hypothetical protein HDV00_009339 [Rhizophlyctis rosea]|nr:hypothetical protein HDV00_009339 [Rhizophlyctis rosea]
MGLLPQELIDYIILFYTDVHTCVLITTFFGSPYIKSKLPPCKNKSNPYHRCTPMCRILAVQFLRQGEARSTAVMEIFKTLPVKSERVKSEVGSMGRYKTPSAPKWKDNFSLFR